MFPNQQNQNGGQPYGSPQPYSPPQAPIQQAPSGQYEVVPPLPAGANNGHTGHNPYEFIVNPGAPKRRSLSLGGGNPFLMRIFLLVGGAVVIMIVAAIILSALAPKGSTPGLISIAQRQQEIVRIASTATTQASGLDIQNFAATVAASVTSDQQATLAFLQAHGTKLSTKTLALDQDTKTDSILADAATAGTYDTAVTQNLTEQLQTYESLLAQTFKETNNKQSKQLLQSNFSNASVLVARSKALNATN